MKQTNSFSINIICRQEWYGFEYSTIVDGNLREVAIARSLGSRAPLFDYTTKSWFPRWSYNWLNYYFDTGRIEVDYLWKNRLNSNI